MSEKSTDENDENDEGGYPCPCCGYDTLSERGSFEICPICFWEDDGLADSDPDRIGGPNHTSLTEGRKNYIRVGACEQAALRSVRPPLPSERLLRRFVLEGDRVVERAPLSPETIWNLLHDGHIHALARTGTSVNVTASALYLRERFSTPGDGFTLELRDCTRFDYQPYDGAVITDLDAIAKEEPDFVQAKSEGRLVTIWGSEGVLRAEYAAVNLFLRMSDGSTVLLSLDELYSQARAYWNEFSKRS
jgi:hypothetical protein